MLQRLLLAACLALGLFGDTAAQTYQPGYSPGFKPGFHFDNGGFPLAPDAVADYDFARARYYGSPITVTRSSSGYIDDTAGNWTLVASNTARRSDKGLLVEEARTNLALQSSDFTQANWTKLNATAALNQVGFDGTPNSASLLTATAANGQATQAITSASAARVTSVFLRCVVCTGAVQITQDGTSWTTVAPTSAWGRFSLPVVTSANPIVGVRLAISGNSVAVDTMQQEVGSGVSSPIRTTGSTVTRAADVISAPISDLTTAATVAAVARPGPASSLNQLLAVISDGAVTNRILAARSPAQQMFIAAVPPSVVIVSPDAKAADARVGLAAAFAANDRSISVDGSAVTTNATAGAFPSGMINLHIGHSGAGATQFNGYIERLAVRSVRAANDNLQFQSNVANW